MENDSVMGPGYISKSDLCKKLQIDSATISRKVKAGKFPPPVYLFSRARFKLADIEAWERANISTTHNLRRASGLKHARPVDP